LGGHRLTGIRAGSPDAGAIVWNVAAATRIVATTAKTVQNLVDAASISVSPPLVVGGERPIGPQRADHGFQMAH
jgi:hypothetical protein